MENYILAALGGSASQVLSINYKGKLNKQIRHNSGGRREMICVAISPDGIKNAWGNEHGEIEIKEIASGKSTAFLYLSRKLPMIIGMDFLGNDLLAVAGSDMQVRIYDLLSGKTRQVLTFPSYFFGIRGISEKLMAGFSRDNSGDHLSIYNIATGECEYLGPAFKICKSYLRVRIGLDEESGIIAHGDRQGNLHIYDMANHYAHKMIDTGHGDFYGIIFQAGELYTGGHQDNKLKSWDISSGKMKQALILSSGVRFLARMSDRILIASLAGGLGAIIDVSKWQQLDQMMIGNIKDMAGLSMTYIKKVSGENRRIKGEKLLREIQENFQNGDYESTKRAILELEKAGFQREALQALYALENKYGNRLNELEVLFALSTNIDFSPDNISYFDRLIELLEELHEPEIAIQVVNAIINETGNKDKYANILGRMGSKCMQNTECEVVFAGDGSLSFVRAEIRKAEILNRFFENMTAFKKIKLKKLEEEIAIEGLEKLLLRETEISYAEINFTTIIWKTGDIIAEKKVLKLVPDFSGSEGYEVIIEIEKDMSAFIPVIFEIFSPGKNNSDPEWNLLQLNKYNNLINSKQRESWIKQLLVDLETALVNTCSGSEFDW